jgi:hypothetical protein
LEGLFQENGLIKRLEIELNPLKGGHMKHLRLVFLALAGSVALLAQMPPSIVADIPFAFESANQKLPAGQYEVLDIPNANFQLLRNSETGTVAMVTGFVHNYGSGDPKDARLVFNKYGDRYFLSEIGFLNVSRQVMKSKSEKALVTTTLITANRQQVVIYAKLR